MTLSDDVDSGGVTRRSVLQIGVMAASGLLLAGHGTRSASASAPDRGSAEPSEQALWEIHELARRISQGEGERRPNGVVIIDGWTLPPSHVALIRELGPEGT
jgi:hypothetical protein